MLQSISTLFFVILCGMIGYSLIVINACDEEALIDKRQWCMEHQDKLSSMGAQAMETAKQYSWERYEEGIGDSILKTLKKIKNN